MVTVTAQPKQSKKAKEKKTTDVVELFNLADDPYEKTNLAERSPDRVKELRARYESYARQAVAPQSKPQDPTFKTPKVWGEKE